MIIMVSGALMTFTPFSVALTKSVTFPAASLAVKATAVPVETFREPREGLVRFHAYVVPDGQTGSVPPVQVGDTVKFCVVSTTTDGPIGTTVKELSMGCTVTWTAALMILTALKVAFTKKLNEPILVVLAVKPMTESQVRLTVP